MTDPHAAGSEDTLPEWFRDRWRDRPDPLPGQGVLYWHMLVGGDREIAGLARMAQRRLAPFSGFHLTPLQWLHITALACGPVSQVAPGGLQQMIRTASRILSEAKPPLITVGRLRYHPEGIMVAVEPEDALAQVRAAVLAATSTVTGHEGEDDGPWSPHITLGYSTARQPAAPVVAALGSARPAREARIKAVSLVIQHGPERRWDWQVAGTIHLGRTTAGNRSGWPAGAVAARGQLSTATRRTTPQSPRSDRST